MGHLAGECSGPYVKNGRSLTGQHHEVLFSPDNSVLKFSRAKMYEISL